VLAIVGLAAVSAILVPTYAVPTIRSADIFDGEIKTADLANNAVTSPKIQDGQVTTADLASDAVPTAKIKNGEVTSDDIKDKTIQSGDIADGVIPSGGGALQVEERSEFFDVLPGNDPVPHTFHVSCNSDETLTGGGYSSNSDETIVRFNSPTADNTGWLVVADNPTSDTNVIQVHALCAKIVP
jgi:hypothetical protein